MQQGGGEGPASESPRSRSTLPHHPAAPPSPPRPHGFSATASRPHGLTGSRCWRCSRGSSCKGPPGSTPDMAAAACCAAACCCSGGWPRPGMTPPPRLAPPVVALPGPTAVAGWLRGSRRGSARAARGISTGAAEPGKGLATQATSPVWGNATVKHRHHATAIPHRLQLSPS